MNVNMQQTISHWGYVSSFAHLPHNNTEYEKLLSFADELMSWSRSHKDERAASFLRLIAENIEEYEKKRYPIKKVSPIQMLKFLMEEHSLGQNDLPEIGSQSLVSKILNGERKLTIEHVRGLSKKFGVSPNVFF